MKKHLIYVWAMLFALATPVLTSCGDDNDEPSGGKEIPVRTVSDQKEYLEQVGIEFLQQYNADDFRKYVDLVGFISMQIDESNTDNFEPWINAFFEKTFKEIGSRTVVASYDSWTDITYINEGMATILASNLTGHWTLDEENKWQCEEADDLKFFMDGPEGEPLELGLTQQGEVKTVHVTNMTDDYNYSYDYSEHQGTHNEDVTDLYVGFPETLLITFKQNGKTLIEEKMNFDLKGIQGNEFDMQKSTLGFNGTTKLDNGYTIECENLTYNSQAVAGKAYLTKGGKKLLTVALTGDIQDMPSISFVGLQEMEEEDGALFEKTNGAAGVNVDVLGKVQLKGTIADIRQFIMDGQQTNEFRSDEEKFKQALANLNSHLDVNLYYDGTVTKQAAFQFMPERRENGYEIVGEQTVPVYRWDIYPGIAFPDGSSYFIDDFFNEENFKNLIEVFYKMVESFSGLVEVPDKPAHPIGPEE